MRLTGAYDEARTLSVLFVILLVWGPLPTLSLEAQAPLSKVNYEAERSETLVDQMEKIRSEDMERNLKSKVADHSIDNRQLQSRFRPQNLQRQLIISPTIKKKAQPTRKPTSKPTIKPITKPTAKPTIKPTSTVVLQISSSASIALVQENDTTLVPPRRSNIPLLAPITAFTWNGDEYDPSIRPDRYERPIYKEVNRKSPDFWKYIVDELLLARVPLVLLASRGCQTTDSDAGIMCPRRLRDFVAAVRSSSGASDVLRIAMFDDTNTYRFQVNPDGAPMDLKNRTNWDYFWSYNIKPFFETIPRDMWFLYDGKPVIMEWRISSSMFTNQQGNASALITWLKSRFRSYFGVEPLFILDEPWFSLDTTITTAHALGQHGWFTPVSDVPSTIYSYRKYNNEIWGVIAPAFRNGRTLIGCGSQCREVTRRNGDTLRAALNAGKDAKIIALEGWTDMVEGAGFYRSGRWEYPSQYINIVRSYADPAPVTLRFEAEAADAFYDTTIGNAGDEYSLRGLDVGKLPDNSSWFVGWVDVGEWIEYKQVQLGCGSYRFSARAATDAPEKRLQLLINDELRSNVTLPNTSSRAVYQTIHLGQFNLQAGTYSLKIRFDTVGGLNLDWIFLRKLTSC